MSQDDPRESQSENSSNAVASQKERWILRAWDHRGSIRPWLKGWLDVLQPIVTITGILAAAWWFLAQATYATRVATTLRIESRELAEGDYCFYSVSIKLTNSGFVPVSINYASVRMERILPLDDQIRDELAQKHLTSRRDPEKTLIDWPMVDKRTKDPYLILYPGDTDTVLFDLVVPCAVKLMRLHSVISAKKDLLPGTAIWTQDELVDAPSTRVADKKEK